MHVFSARRLVCSTLGVCAGGAVLLVALTIHRAPPIPLRFTTAPGVILADGFSPIRLTIEAAEPPSACQVDILQGDRLIHLDSVTAQNGRCGIRLHPGILPGRAVVRAQSPGYLPAVAEINLTTQTSDAFSDGTPDYLRLEEDSDRQSFRRWFAFLAEAQYFRDSAQVPPEINDCAALIRYAYREALTQHDNVWAARLKLPLVPGIPSVHKYSYPYTPLQAGIFRVRPGSFVRSDESTGAFAQFADANSLRRWNTSFVSRDFARAETGDLLFYKPTESERSYHSMIYLGASQVERSSNRYVVYHTGPTGEDPGEIRRLTSEELLRFPAAQWRPEQSNSNFLGIYRWNILRKAF